MRRGVILLVAAIAFSGMAYGQLSGNGSISSPYSGTLTSDLIITGTKYFGGNITVDNETLTLSPGAKFISTSSSACIRITGTGWLYAVGTTTSPILISADIDKDGINGEAGELWGNLYITSTGNITISYVTLENGSRTNAKLGSMGGGLYLSSSTVKITHSTIKNCIAIKGGGVYVASGHSPSISSTIFKNNRATESGGAAYISSNASPVFADNIFISNNAALPGGAVASISGSPKLQNCDFLYSTSTAGNGKALYLENSGNAVVINSVIWGGTNQITLSGTPSTVINACAIEGESYPGSLNLSSTNNDPTGPNFTNPAGENFLITFDSPLRDAGLASYSGITISTTDFIGTKRVGDPDIGAYEVLYSRWLGTATADWLRPINWDKSYTPGTTRNVVVPAGRTNYPTLTPGPTFILNTGLKMIVEAGAKVTFNSLTNSGTIVLEANATERASLMTTSYSGNSGYVRIKQFVSGGYIVPDVSFRWHYIAPPTTVDKSVITDITPYDLMMYDESKVTSDISQGWQWHDGYDGTTAFSSLVANNGYLIWFPEDTILVYDNLRSITTTIGQVNLPFSGSGADTSLYGYKCIGNSLTCGINWDLVTISDPVNVRDAIYIQAGDVVASYVNGVGTNGGSAHIAPLQGFMVKTRAVGTYITIPNTAREHTSSMLLKSSSQIPLFRISLLSSEKGTSDETVIRLDNNASLDFDGDYDASKIIAKSLPQIYTVLSGEDYSINAIPLPDTQTEMPLALMIPVAGNFTIVNTETILPGEQKLWLTDKSNNTTIDLTSVKEYSFSSDAGLNTSRFIITISENFPGTQPATEEKAFRLTQTDNAITVIPEGELWDGGPCTVRVFDSSGRLLLVKNNEYLSDGDHKDYYINKPNGILIVEVTKTGTRYTQKMAFSQ